MIEKKIFTKFHKSTQRNYISRMKNEKVLSMNRARKYDYDYWDGDRRYGYGGYKYIPGLLTPLAIKIIKEYNLDDNSSVLDAGCGKGFILYEIKKILPNIKISGFDISRYALKNSKKEIKQYLFMHNIKNNFPFKKNSFDLVISFNCLHNLKIFDLKNALKEINRVGVKKFIVIEGYRDCNELFNLQCWALTAQAFFHKEEWLWIFRNFRYSGDYELIYFS